MLIRNPDLDFSNFDSKIHFWANLGGKTQNCPFCLKIGTQWYLGNADSKSGLKVLKFRPQNPFLGKFGSKNLKLLVLSENWCMLYLKDADSKSRLIFFKFRLQNPFLGKFGRKNSKLSILVHNGILEMQIPNLGLEF